MVLFEVLVNRGRKKDFIGRTGKGENEPIGTLTPTNFPFCNAGPVFGTKFPRMIPIAIARNIHRARKRSSQPRPLNVDIFSFCVVGGDVSWFSRSMRESGGWKVGRADEDVSFFLSGDSDESLSSNFPEGSGLR